MADHAVVEEDIYVYTGGRAPHHVVNAIIDQSVDKIGGSFHPLSPDAFHDNQNLQSVVGHDGVLKVCEWAFGFCRSLQHVKMPGVKIIECSAFNGCRALTHVEFGDKLETVGWAAFDSCESLKQVKFSKLKTIGLCAFEGSGVQDAEFGEDLETIGSLAFGDSKLTRIAIPLKDGMFERDDYPDSYGKFYSQFHRCPLATVDLVGGIHKTVASLHLESWRNEMNEEIQRINQVLPGTVHHKKSRVVVNWIRSVCSRIEHYKAEHRVLLEEATALLELALWKAKLAGFTTEDDKDSMAGKTAKKAKIDDEGGRKEARITSGADIIIKNVLPYLKMD